VRILVVEDDATLADGLTRSLSAGGYALDWADNGLKADAALAQESYDLVILDIGLPGLSGLEVLRRLRHRGARTPVLILTARDATEDRVQGLDLGADDYLVKPFSLPELEARVRALIRRGHAASSPLITHGSLGLDTVAKRAYLRGEALELTPREWGVLEVLLLRAGHVVSKDQIVQALCSWDDDLTPNAVEVYISRLRAKLEGAGIKIRTVRGFGYLLMEPDEAGH
jgi:two-component system OmpR family response regulator